MEQFVVVRSGSNFVLLKTVVLSSGLATKSKPSQTFFLHQLPHGLSMANDTSHGSTPFPLPLYVVS